jgi:hypothetical protein
MVLLRISAWPLLSQRRRLNKERQVTELVTVIQKLYAKEINVGLQANWDAGIQVWIGDDPSGHLAEQTFTVGQLPYAGKWLMEMARVHYPDVDFGHP